MSRAEHRPFDNDIEAHGRYQYTGSDRFSTVRANRRFSDMILAAADHARPPCGGRRLR